MYFVSFIEDTHRHIVSAGKGSRRAWGEYCKQKRDWRELTTPPRKIYILLKMADERSPRRRKRTFSTTSTISTDDYQDASEQIVEDITLEFFYKPRSITALACLVVYLIYSAFTRWPSFNQIECILIQNWPTPAFGQHLALTRSIVFFR